MNIAQIEAQLAREGLSPTDMEQFCSTESRVTFADELTGEETNIVDVAVDESDMLADIDRERVLEKWGHLLSQYEDEDPTEEPTTEEPTGFGFLTKH